MAAPTTNSIVVIQNEEQWIKYKERWDTPSWGTYGGKPIRYPCVVTSITYFEDKNKVKHVFAYEELLIAFKRCKREKRVFKKTGTQESVKINK